MRIALLSNINMNATVKMLSKSIEIYDAEGYGNELGILANPSSKIHEYMPAMVFMIEDLMEIIGHDLGMQHVEIQVEQWFKTFENSIKDQCVYYVSDSYLWGEELPVIADIGYRFHVEQVWLNRLEKCVELRSNVRIFPYRDLIQKLGEEKAFSLTMWHMGSILLSIAAQESLCQKIIDRAKLEEYVPKKVLLLDLDNTLWGGLAGEDDNSPILLSDDHGGLAYKNLQRVISQMQRQGVVLGIVSKNNNEDAMKILNTHPHMVLTPNQFAIKKINWRAKHENIEEVAKELNLGLDSIVFFDDNPAERQLIKEMLPDVTVADFPDRPEDLASSMVQIYKQYFEKSIVTNEDLQKTEQYIANVQREEFKQSTGNFDDYLKNLQINLTRVNTSPHIERIVQLINKTNQFNLTTKRHTQVEVVKILENAKMRCFTYRVEDCFGDNGIVAVAIVDVHSEIPTIIEFVMSCRVMGKNIENAIINDIEESLEFEGYSKIRGVYCPTNKNKPVCDLYKKLGYKKVATSTKDELVYEIELPSQLSRKYYVNKFVEE